MERYCPVSIQDGDDAHNGVPSSYFFWGQDSSTIVDVGDFAPVFVHYRPQSDAMNGVLIFDSQVREQQHQNISYPALLNLPSPEGAAVGLMHEHQAPAPLLVYPTEWPRISIRNAELQYVVSPVLRTLGIMPLSTEGLDGTLTVYQRCNICQLRVSHLDILAQGIEP